MTFAFYGLARKTASVEALTGLAIETLYLTPLAVLYLLYQQFQLKGVFLHSNGTTDLLLIGAGVVTAIPLLFFAHAVRRLRLTTIGIVQYIAPIMQFLLAVFLYKEAFTTTHLISFSFIRLAVILYSIESLYFERTRHTLSLPRKPKKKTPRKKHPLTLHQRSSVEKLPYGMVPYRARSLQSRAPWQRFFWIMPAVGDKSRSVASPLLHLCFHDGPYGDQNTT